MSTTFAATDEYTCHSVHVTQPYTGTTAGASAKLNPTRGMALRKGKIGLAANVLTLVRLWGGSGPVF